MGNLNWDKVRQIANSGEMLTTKTGVPFQIVAVSLDTLIVKVSTGEEYPILRKTLKKAIAKIGAGLILNGPKDYRENVADERPAYAWAILKHLGLLKE
jgi:hypothetical protein